MKDNLKNKKGITLIALVITIIVLLILAIVTIRMVVNQNIINHANNAVTAYNEAQTNETEQLTWAEELMKNKGVNGKSSSDGETKIEAGDLSKITEEEIAEWRKLEPMYNNGQKLEDYNEGLLIAGSDEKDGENVIAILQNINNIQIIDMFIDGKEYGMVIDENFLTNLPSNVELNKLYEMRDGGEEFIPCTTNPIEKDKFSIIYCETYLNRIIAAVNDHL